jgi:hypothetical protein
MTSIVLYVLYAMYIAVPIVLCFALFSLVMLCVNWKTEHRTKYARRLGVSLASVPLISGAIYVTAWFVLMPIVAHDQAKQYAATKAAHFSETTLVKLGDRSPEFSVKTLSGENFVAPQRDKVVVVNFFAT